jgi:hypothetical protein
MNADTPHDRRHREAPLLRTTDYARRLLRRAQFALAVLAVPVSMTVGIVVAGSEPGPVSAGPAGPPGLEQMSLVGSPAMLGLTAGLVTLTICWLILGAAALGWRHRLHERDLRDWAEGWAQAEPVWSDRRL